MITEECIRDILGGKTLFPHYMDVKMLQCPRQPMVDILLKKFNMINSSCNLLNNCGVNELRVPDKRWLLDFVSTFKPDDEIFSKDYRPPAKANKLSKMKTVWIETKVSLKTSCPPSARSADGASKSDSRASRTRRRSDLRSCRRSTATICSTRR